MARRIAALFASCFVLPSLASLPIGEPCFANESAMQLHTEVDLSGKVAVVTGCDKGIGLEVARALAARKAKVVLAVRKTEELKATADAIREVVPDADVFLPDALYDLSSFAQVRAFAKSLQQFEGIDILVNNAAVDNNPGKIVTKDGYELAFQADYMSQWLFTELMLPQVRKAKGRIVQLVSKAYRLGCPMSKQANCMDLKKLPPPVIPGGDKVPILNIPVTNYGIARLLIIRYTEDLAAREAAANSGVVAFSVNPGFVNTSMAKGSNLSPLFKWLGCHTESRPGSPCPARPDQGALTPTFLALHPDLQKDSGKFFEWCAPAKVTQCMDLEAGPAVCAGADQKYKDGLRNLTQSWLKNFTQPLADAKDGELVAIGSMVDMTGACPDWLKPLCDRVQNLAGCLSCGKQVSTCIADPECKNNLLTAVKCLAKLKHAPADEQLKCFVPVNAKRDALFYCLLDEHNCIPAGKSNASYPACRDHEIVGDSSFDPTHMVGDWWKISAWMKGEQYECRPCGHVKFWPYSELPWPVTPPADTSDYNVISSEWLEQNIDGKWLTVNETSLFGPRPGHQGYPSKQQHVGVMYGLSYLENFTIVHDGTQEKEPFVFLYGCGSTKQGAYVTGFVMGKQPVASAALTKRIAEVAKKNGFDDPDSWCTVDNSCVHSKPQSLEFII
eukprot:TRINITY_DN91334_c0_g1_i1.p1 TRINITY_DN91334_c0_g1~~TRINITY_DN91334_c0_g1_i1.p1  ORF type:complete len:671 (+),score=117.63 TRINITY_DN91334_c0_g1_i1:61-2073(+)